MVRSIAAALVLTTSCAAGPPARTPAPAPSAAASPAPIALAEPRDGEGSLRCPPPQPPPREEPPRCGNGRVDVEYLPIVAPCIPGRCCASGWAPRPVEECDGRDLGGRTCAALGHAGGTLRCTAECRVDASGCEATARSMVSGEGVTLRAGPTVADAISGKGPALARNGSVLALAAAADGALRVRTFDAASLAPLGPARDTAPLFSDPDPERLWSRALLAPLRDGFVAAVGQVSSTFLVLLRPGRDPEPREGSAVGLPLFLAGDGDGALLGLEPHVSGYPVQLVHLDRGGSPDWRAITALEAARPAYGNSAAAARVGEDWLVVAGSRSPDASEPLRTGLFSAQVTPTAVVRGAGFRAPAAGSVALASENGRALAVYVGARGVEALDVTAPGAQPLLLVPRGDHGFERVLAAELRDGTLTALVAAAPRGRPAYGERPAGGAAYLLRATLATGAVAAPELVFSAPALRPTAGLVEGGRIHLLYGDAAGRQTLWSAR